MSAGERAPGAKIEIFRASGAQDLAERHLMEYVDLSPVIAAGMDRVVAEGVLDGTVVKTLFSMPGFSLTYAWFKSGFPLPPHAHNSDCLYYVIAGELTMGTELLRAGDGFFVPAHVGYSYVPGPNGVEIVEFRHTEQFTFRFLARSESAWEKIVQKLREHHPNWADERAPREAGGYL